MTVVPLDRLQPTVGDVTVAHEDADPEAEQETDVTMMEEAEQEF